MKKIIGILAVVTISITLMFNSNSSENSDTDLASLIAMNLANAEHDYVYLSGCRKDPGDNCTSGTVTQFNCDEGLPSGFSNQCKYVIPH